MIFADINWLNISINLLLVVFVIVCLLMSLLILMQRPKQEGLGAAFGGGVTDQVFGARTTNVLQRGTVYLGSMFFILALTLAILIGQQSKQKSLLEPAEPAAEAEASETAGEAGTAEAPAEEPSGSLLDELPVEETPAKEATAEEATSEESPAPVSEEAPAGDAAEAPAGETTPEPTAPAAGENEADKSE